MNEKTNQESPEPALLELLKYRYILLLFLVAGLISLKECKDTFDSPIESPLPPCLNTNTHEFYSGTFIHMPVPSPDFTYVVRVYTCQKGVFANLYPLAALAGDNSFLAVDELIGADPSKPILIEWKDESTALVTYFLLSHGTPICFGMKVPKGNTTTTYSYNC